MKRLSLVLAAASVLGTGCFGSSTPCTHSVTVDWSGGFLGSDGQRRGCTDAGVTWVDLFINGDATSAARIACTAGAAQAVDLPAGNSVLTIEGVESGGRIAYRDEPAVTTACGDQHVPVSPAEGTLALDYSFAPSNVCYATQPTFIWTKVFDDLGNDVAFLDNGTGAANLCSTTAAAPTYRLPVGSFTLLGVNEVSQSVGIVGADCSHPRFTIAAAVTTTVTPVLVDSAQACF